MNNERTEAPTAHAPSFAQVGLLRAVRVPPVVQTAAQVLYGVDNSLCADGSNHHDHHHDHHRS